ncbi:MAG: adenylyl-sulfate kinase [Oscillospiraceae bacterium]|nr:adenylyl-sulfate kinase [Oscillospiraceae bacterium]
MAQNRVYWLTGLSGAGKTTIGQLWFQQLKEAGENVVFLDGDELRQVFGGSLGYTSEDRRKAAMNYARLCALLSKQGLTVICCTISMFDSVRKWNRENIPGYFEVYIQASMETLRHRDQKGLYSRNADNVAGVGLQVELPDSSDLVLDNNGQWTPEEQVARLYQTVFGTEG